MDREFLGLLRKLPRLGWAEAAMAARMAAFVMRHPRTCGIVLRYLSMYVQIRHVYDYTGAWDASLGLREAPACELRMELARAS